MLLADVDVILGQIIQTVGLILVVWMQIRSNRKIEQVHKATNSLTERLVETTRTEAHAAGIKEEKERKPTA